jgi:hypothetical protein
VARSAPAPRRRRRCTEFDDVANTHLDISISMRTTCVRDFGCLDSCGAGSWILVVPGPRRARYRIARQRVTAFKVVVRSTAWTPTSVDGTHPVLVGDELGLVGGWCVGIRGGAPRRWPRSRSHTPPTTFGRGGSRRSKAVQEAVSASGNLHRELAPHFAQDCATIDSRCRQRTSEAAGQTRRIDDAFDRTSSVERV